MLRSRVFNQCSTFTSRSYQVSARRFHASPRSQWSINDVSNTISSIPDLLPYTSPDLSGLLVIPLLAATPNLVRIWWERRKIREGYHTTYIQPLLGIIRHLNDQSLAHGRPTTIDPDDARKVFLQASPQQAQGKMFGGQLLPLLSHASMSAAVFMYLRVGTAFYQDYFQTPFENLVASLSQHQIADNLTIDIQSYLTSLEPVTIGTLSTATLTLFCIYQYRHVFVKSQFWKGWDAECSDKLPASLLASKGGWEVDLRHGRLTARPRWIGKLQNLDWATLKRYYRMVKQKPALLLQFSDEIFYAFAVLLVSSAIFMRMNPAQLLYFVLSSSFARYRARAGRKYEAKLGARLRRKDQEWQRLQPVERRRL